MSFVVSFLQLVQPLSSIMTAPSFQNFITVMTGWLFARCRTVTGMLVAAAATHSKHFSTMHRFFSAAHWSLDRLGLAVATLVLQHVDGLVDLTLDDTLSRKRGLQM